MGVISTLGTPIPNTPHAVSVCMPTWQDNVDYEEGRERVRGVLRSGYPRFVYHSHVVRLFELCRAQLSPNGEEECIVFPSARVARECLDFLAASAAAASATSSARVASIRLNGVDLFAVLHGRGEVRVAKAFWQHTGEIVSSRLAEFAGRGAPGLSESEEIDEYVEEHYGRNMSWSAASAARNALRRRISDHVGASKQHVFLFPCGMSAIYNAFRFARRLLPGRRAVQFGFPYLDTLNILQKFGSGAHFFGLGDRADLDRLEQVLQAEPIMAVFCEFPSNPLLQCADLHRLRLLADRFGFPLVIDDTLGSFNVDLLPFADIIVSSLTKVFSGDSNVMGGCLVLNSKSKFFPRLWEIAQEDYEDLLWSQDAVFLERNSRNFDLRVAAINSNAQRISHFLASHPKVKHVYYPEFEGKEMYDSVKHEKGGYGGLFSLVLHDPSKAPLLFDNLNFCKGPSLGTNFTLCCPYAILAHYDELEKVRPFGVVSDLIRVSIGMESYQFILQTFVEALDKI